MNSDVVERERSGNAGGNRVMRWGMMRDMVLGLEAVLADVAALASRLRERLPPGRVLAGVGLGVPELVDLQGRVTSGHTIDWRGMCALAVIMVIPALTLTFIVQKHLVGGLTSGAVKG